MNPIKAEDSSTTTSTVGGIRSGYYKKMPGLPIPVTTLKFKADSSGRIEAPGRKPQQQEPPVKVVEPPRESEPPAKEAEPPKEPEQVKETESVKEQVQEAEPVKEPELGKESEPLKEEPETVKEQEPVKVAEPAAVPVIVRETKTEDVEPQLTEISSKSIDGAETDRLRCDVFHCTAICIRFNKVHLESISTRYPDLQGDSSLV